MEVCDASLIMRRGWEREPIQQAKINHRLHQGASVAGISHKKSIDRLESQLEEMKRFTTPYTFIKYARWVAENSIDLLARIEERETGMRHEDYRIVEDTVETPYTAKHVTIPVLAFYNTANALRVDIASRGGRVNTAVKAAGANWVPLCDRTMIIFAPGQEIVVEPRPEHIVVLRLEPRGKAVTMDEKAG